MMKKLLVFVMALFVGLAGVMGVEETKEKLPEERGRFKLKWLVTLRLRRAIAKAKQWKRETIEKYLKMVRGNRLTHKVTVGESVTIRGRAWYRGYQTVKKDRKWFTYLIPILSLVLAVAVHPMFGVGLVGATIVSNQDGNWDDGATWVGGSPPADTDDVSIGHTVSLNGNRTCAGVVFTAGGSIVPTNTTDTFTINGDLNLDNGTLGSGSWTGDLSIAGDVSGNGTFLSSIQSIYVNGSGTWDTSGFTGNFDGVRIADSYTLTLGASQTFGALRMTAGTVVGGGYTLTLIGTTKFSEIFRVDSTISGILDINIQSSVDERIIRIPYSTGKPRNITINNTGKTISSYYLKCTGNLTLTAGALTWVNTTDPLSVEGNLVINGTLGASDWTGDLTIGGNMSGTGTYLHSTQEVTFNGNSKHVEGEFTFYDIVIDGNLFFGGGDRGLVTVEHNLTINSGKKLMMRGYASGGDILTLGTASASGTIINNGTFEAGYAGSGTTNIYIQGVNASYHAELTGAGVYDWDVRGSNGELHWKWLNHKGTDATAKTTGGNGVTIVLDGPVKFYQDFEVASGDIFDQNSQRIIFYQIGRMSGTQQNPGEVSLNGGTCGIENWNGTNMSIASGGTITFDGTCEMSGSVSFSVSGSLIPYDADSVLNVAGGITVPTGAYFGADSSGNMGDGNPASNWSADMSWGWFKYYGPNLTFTSGKVTLTSKDGSGYVWVYGGEGPTFNWNNGTFEITTSTGANIRHSNGAALFHNLIINTSSTIKIASMDYITVNHNLTVLNGTFRASLDSYHINVDGELTIQSNGTFGHSAWAPTSDCEIGSITCNGGTIYFPAVSGGGKLLITGERNGYAILIAPASNVTHNSGHIQISTSDDTRVIIKGNAVNILEVTSGNVVSISRQMTYGELRETSGSFEYVDYITSEGESYIDKETFIDSFDNYMTDVNPKTL